MNLATALHQQKCHSMRNGTCNGAEHLTIYQPLAKRIANANNPAGELHSIVCDAIIDPTFGRCPDHDRHVAHLARWLERHNTTQGVLDLEGTP